MLYMDLPGQNNVIFKSL